MLINKLVKKCDERYKDIMESCQCDVSKCVNHKGRDCYDCLHEIHYPKSGVPKRTYDCAIMADYYYCRYSYRYASEIICGLRHLGDIGSAGKIKVLSIGCGPCTELAAIDYLQKKGVYNYKEIDFRGIDLLKDIWGNIWGDIEDIYQGKVTLIEKNALEYVDILAKENWVPDLIIFQYVFSDMRKKYSYEQICHFIDKISEFINTQTGKNIYILINDTNAGINYNAGRDFFDILEDKIINKLETMRYHFNIDYKDKHYEYGTHYVGNELFFVIPKDIRARYNPWASCASAQIIIKKAA